MNYRVQVLKDPLVVDNTGNEFRDLPLNHPDSINAVLGAIAEYLNHAYGEDRWYINNAGQFVHAADGDFVVAMLNEVEETYTPGIALLPGTPPDDSVSVDTGAN